MIEQVHRRGYLLPSDCLKDSNWLIDSKRQPHIIDLGESAKASRDIRQAEFQRKRDLRSFHNLVYKYIDTVGRKEKGKLEDILLRDYYLNK